MRAVILLAAGEGRRFGRAPKPLARRHGRPLVAHALRAAGRAPAARLLVVVGRQADRVAAVARRHAPAAVIVRARRWRDGLDASLAAGAAALRPCERAAYVFLADMPLVPRGIARRLPPNARAAHRGRPGHPVLLDRAALAGTRKGLALVPADRRCRFDVDRRRDLLRPVPALMR